eukprot:TRINITY_DN22537_c0_g1_i1.p1 TRINITY_DN22537_c0_g1~~TRINITY_DN22537_c0_g1_i1.p1  ORF type:complete len:619 (+),score=89.50 TRINITY_DN22537_c0_g1_i1:56-1912(+)
MLSARPTDRCDVTVMESVVAACDVVCCYSKGCSCYDKTHGDGPHADMARWCVWSFCVIDGTTGCDQPKHIRDTLKLAHEWQHMCDESLLAHNCDVRSYSRMHDCLSKLPCWVDQNSPDHCDVSCVNKTRSCQVESGCGGDDTYKGQLTACREESYAVCAERCGNCLTDSCSMVISEAMVPPSTETGLTMSSEVTIAVIVSCVFCLLCIVTFVFFWKWKRLTKMVTPTDSVTGTIQSKETLMTGTSTASFKQQFDIKDSWQRGNLVGRGQFGTVYVALLPGGHVLAVKQIDATDVMNDHAARSQYIHEIEALQNMSHPYIVKYFGAYLDTETRMINLFMEYVSGGSLARFVKSLPYCLEEDAVKVYIRQILEALLYLHSHNVVHRDIKGENVLLNTEEGTVKITDFGSSRKIQRTLQTAGGATLTGTPNWMAPEMITAQVYNDIPHKEKIDVWSVGCTTVELLCKGKPPWPAFDTQWSALYYIANSKDLVPDGIPDDVSADCRNVIERCLDRDPATRISVSELLKHPWFYGSAVNFKFDSKAIHFSDVDLDTMISGLKQKELEEKLPAGETNITQYLKSRCQPLVQFKEEDRTSHTSPVTKPITSPIEIRDVFSDEEKV